MFSFAPTQSLHFRLLDIVERERKGRREGGKEKEGKKEKESKMDYHSFSKI